MLEKGKESKNGDWQDVAACVKPSLFANNDRGQPTHHASVTNLKGGKSKLQLSNQVSTALKQKLMFRVEKDVFTRRESGSVSDRCANRI